MSSVLTNKLRSLRKKANYTQEYVAKYLNIERQAYCNYENGARGLPLEVIVKLAELYQVSIDTLVKDGDSHTQKYLPLTPSEAEFLESFRALSPQKQQETIAFVNFKHSSKF